MGFLFFISSYLTLLWFGIEQNDEVVDHERVIRGDLGLGQERKVISLEHGTSLVNWFMLGPERAGLVMIVRLQRSQSLMKVC